MKTFTKALFATLMTAIIITATAMTSAAAHSYKNFDTPIRGINKIWVSGNVKVVLRQSDVESVFVDGGYNSDNTSIQSKGQTLYINSTEPYQVTIKVSVKDLQRIEAAGSATVVTTSNFDVKYLQVFLSQCATAKVKANAGSVYTVIKDDAILKMNGTAKEHVLVASNMKNARMKNFVSLKTESRVSGIVARKADSLSATLVK